MDKRIITWKWGNNPTNDEHTATRGFIFGNYGSSAADYATLVDEALKDFPHLTVANINLGKVTKSGSMKGFALVTFLLAPNQMHEAYDAWDRFDFSYI